MIRHLHASLAAVVSLLAGCTDFDLPSALTREQIIAVRSTPSALVPGSRGQLEAVVAGPDGLVEDPALSWSIDPLMAGVSSDVAIEIDDDGRAWLAVDEGAAPGGVVVALEVATDGGPITARKTVEVTDEPRDNPGPMGLEAEGRPVGDAVEVAAGASIELAASAEVDAPRYSWYATVGEIERFRHNPTELVAPAEPDEGWLIAVVRDDAGGVAWEVRRLIVTP